MKTLNTFAFGALLLSAGAVSAQDANSALDPAQMDEPTAEATAPAADAAASAHFSDEQIDAFVGAAIDIRALAPEARQEQAGAILAEHGLDPDTYNAIGAAAQSDEDVAERVQLAIAEVSGRNDS